VIKARHRRIEEGLQSRWVTPSWAVNPAASAASCSLSSAPYRITLMAAPERCAMGHIVLTDQGGEVTPSGERFLDAFGADPRPRTRRIFCQPCLDWSERRYHLKALVWARILDRLLELGWLECVSGSRALQPTSSGRAGLSEIFQVEINDEGVPTNRLCNPRRLTA
jgi:hypothetical protein